MSNLERPDPYQILNDLPFSVFTKDNQLRFTWVNDAFAHSVGMRPDEIIGKTDWHLYERSLAESYTRDDVEVLRSGRTIESSERHESLAMRGIAQYVRVFKSPMVLSGQSHGMVCVFMKMDEDSPSRADLDSKEQTIRQTEVQLSKLVQREGTPLEPRVFISYKHAGDEHLRWVRGLATDLIEQYGIHCILDQFDLDYGDSIPAYMQKIQTEATHVLFIITPECVAAVRADVGGVSFEMQLAASLRDRRQLRIIPLLRAGNESPAYVQAHLYIDFRDDSIYLDMLRRLADSIRVGKVRPKANSRPQAASAVEDI